MGTDSGSSSFLSRLLMGLWDLQLTGFCSSSSVVLEELASSVDYLLLRNNAYHHTAGYCISSAVLTDCFVRGYLIAKSKLRF